ncbi:MobA/MobL family protein [Psychrobacter sp. AOP29-E1-4]|uniref:MobA/MobL family protein n=1 Tax=Psychrobacter sp. AOP29-E1-4 TaxID=3457703 RepID=UPI00403700AD
MAIYHATTKPISRSSGRSATASAAYRAGTEIKDERTGLTHDYSKRGGVLLATVFDKDDNEIDRSELWNLAEQAEKRKDARTAREWIVAIPSELMPEYPEQLSDDERRSTELLTDYQLRKEFAEHHAKDFSGTQTALDFGKMLSKKYGVAVDVAIHAPDEEGSNKNYHAHIMTTTREVSLSADGQVEFGDKATIELSNTKRKTLGLGATSIEIKELRAEWAKIANQALERKGFNERIDHRSYAERGIEQLPTQKLGWKASAMERRGLETDRGDINRAINAGNLKIKGLALEIRIDTNKREEQKQALEFQQGMDALRAKQQAAKALQATDTPPSPPKPQIEADIAPVIEGQTVNEALDVQQGFDKMVAQTAEKIRAKTIEPYKADMTRLAAEHKALKDNNSWLGRGKREKQMKELASEYKGIKRDFNATKKRDLTMDAKKNIEHTAPQAHATHEQARETLNYHASFRYGATEAQAGRQYTGEITAVTRLGVMQKTPTGRNVYHDLDSFEELPNVGDKVRVTYNKDNKAELVTVDRAELTRQTQQAELERQQSQGIKIDR